MDHTPDPGAPAASADYRTVALIIASALFMEQLDATVLATAIPTMAHDLGAPVTDLSSALTSYLLALAIFIPTSGRLADRFGSKTIFCTAIVIFVVGSAACGQARSLPFLIAARFVQGIGGAMMVPIARLVLLRTVSKTELVQAMSWLIIPALIGPMIGPPVGGFIVTYLNWRWIFYMNLPVGALGVALVIKFIAEVRGARPPRMDLIGFVLSALSLGCLLFGFQMTSETGKLDKALVLIAVGLIAGALYVRHASRREDAILDLSLMKTPTFRLSVIAGSLTRITQGAQPFLLPLMLQVGFGVSAATSGTITVAGAIGALAMKWLAPRMLRRFGFRNSLIVNGIIASASYAVCGFFRPSWPEYVIFLVIAISGFFMSLQFTAYNTIAYDEIPPEKMSSAASFYATFQQLTLSIGVCLGALALHVGMLATRTSKPELGSFTMAFLVVTLVSATATIWNMRFARDAGAEMSGRRLGGLRNTSPGSGAASADAKTPVGLAEGRRGAARRGRTV